MMNMRIREIIRYPGFFPGFTTLLFSAAIFTAIQAVANPNESSGVAILSKVLLALAFLFLAWWFLHAFTHTDADTSQQVCQAEQSASMFRFAYSFTVYSFALLVLPFTAMLRSNETNPDAGPIRLLRACVLAPATSASSAAASVAASRASGPVGMCPEPHLAGSFSYPWLVSVGGVVAQQCGSAAFKCPEMPAQVAVAANQSASSPKSPPVYSVSGGFVVPFYVVVFAFVGGVVNLTRRVPEYQKRSSCNYVGNTIESHVSLLEAREFVVFQMMQLLSSPFLAMVAYYAVAPQSVATAVGLAFASGFSTESVLLLMRGVVNGLQPATTKTVAASYESATATAQLHVVLRRADNSAVDNARVEVRRLPDASPPIKAGTSASSGEIEFKALQPGTVWVVATFGALTKSKKVQLQAGQTESVDLTLA